MLKKAFRAAVVATLAFVSTTASATPTDDVITGTAYQLKVFSLGTTDDAISEVWLKSGSADWECPSGVNSGAKISRAHPRHDLMYETLLAAALSQHKLTIGYQVIGNNCYIKKVHIVPQAP